MSDTLTDTNLSVGHSRNSSLNSVAEDVNLLEQKLFRAINEGDKDAITSLLTNEDTSDAVLQVILTTVYSNNDKYYTHDEGILSDADALLGPSTKNLNAIQIACMLGDEDIALEILEFINKITEELESKKLLFEFVGRIWGDGNTVLHLASFEGMADLVKRLLELGANPNKRNERGLRPVDCAEDDKTLHIFSTVVPPEAPRLLNRNGSCDEMSTTPTNFKNFTVIDEGSSSSLQKRIAEQALQANLDFERSLHMDKNSFSVRSPGIMSSRSHPDAKLGNENATPAALNKSQSTSSMDNLKMSKSTLGSVSKNYSSSLSNLPHNNPTSPSKRRRTVAFDLVSTILYCCQYGDEVDGPDGVQLEDILKENAHLVKEIRTGHQSLTPLHVACAYNQINIVEYLLKELSVSVNIRDKEGWSPLHGACVEGNVEIVDLLCRCQGSTNDPSEVRLQHPNWFFVEDGPIELNPINEDDETPEDLIGDKRPDEVRKVLNEWKALYPPKPVKYQRILRSNQELDDDLVDESSEEDEYESSQDKLAEANSDSSIPESLSLGIERYQLGRVPSVSVPSTRKEISSRSISVDSPAGNTDIKVSHNNQSSFHSKEQPVLNVPTSADAKQESKPNSTTSNITSSNSEILAHQDSNATVTKFGMSTSASSSTPDIFHDEKSSTVASSEKTFDSNMLSKRPSVTTNSKTNISPAKSHIPVHSGSSEWRQNMVQKSQFAAASSSVGLLKKTDNVRSNLPKAKSPTSSSTNLLDDKTPLMKTNVIVNTTSTGTGISLSSSSDKMNDLKKGSSSQSDILTIELEDSGASNIRSRIMAWENQKK